MKKFIFIFCVMSFLAILGGVVAASPVGCEYYNSTLIECHNQGSIEPVTFFGVFSGDMWNFNDSRQEWLNYETGGFLDLDNRFSLPFEDMSFSYYNDSDYYVVWWEGEVSKGGKSIYINHTRQQGVYDDYVTIYTNITLLSGWHNWHNPIYLYWEMKDIDVWNDGLLDGFNLNNGSLIAWSLNEVGTYTAYDYLTINSITPLNGAVRWLWEGNKTVTVENNHTVVFYDKIEEPFYNGQVISLNYSWIDAEPCIANCDARTVATVEDNESGSESYIQGQQHEVKCTVYDNNLLGHCTLADCSLTLRVNVSAGLPLARLYDTVVEENYTLAWNKVSGLTWQTITDTDPVTNMESVVTAVKPGNHFTRCFLGDMYNLTQSSGEQTAYSIRKPFLINQTLEQNISLQEPVNYFNATLGDTISFNCTRESYWTDFLALSLNDSILYNVTNQGFTNLSYDWVANATGIWEWDCKSYTYGNDTAPWSWNGNYTFTVFPFVKVFYGLADLDSLPIIENAGILAGCLIISGIIILIVRRRRKKDKREEVKNYAE